MAPNLAKPWPSATRRPGQNRSPVCFARLWYFVPPMASDEETGVYNPGTIFATADTLVSPSLAGFSLSLADLFATPSK